MKYFSLLFLLYLICITNSLIAQSNSFKVSTSEFSNDKKWQATDVLELSSSHISQQEHNNISIQLSKVKLPKVSLTLPNSKRSIAIEIGDFNAISIDQREIVVEVRGFTSKGELIRPFLLSNMKGVSMVGGVLRFSRISQESLLLLFEQSITQLEFLIEGEWAPLQCNFQIKGITLFEPDQLFSSNTVIHCKPNHIGLLIDRSASIKPIEWPIFKAQYLALIKHLINEQSPFDLSVMTFGETGELIAKIEDLQINDLTSNGRLTQLFEQIEKKPIVDDTRTDWVAGLSIANQQDLDLLLMGTDGLPNTFKGERDREAAAFFKSCEALMQIHQSGVVIKILGKGIGVERFGRWVNDLNKEKELNINFIDWKSDELSTALDLNKKCKDQKEEIQAPAFSLSPNPAQNTTTILLNNTEKSITKHIILLDAALQHIRSDVISNIDQHNIDLSNLAAGYYFIQVVEENQLLETLPLTVIR